MWPATRKNILPDFGKLDTGTTVENIAGDESTRTKFHREI